MSTISRRQTLKPIIIFVFVWLSSMTVMLSEHIRLLIFCASFASIKQTNQTHFRWWFGPTCSTGAVVNMGFSFCGSSQRYKENSEWRIIWTFRPCCIRSVLFVQRDEFHLLLHSDFLNFIAISWRCTCVVCCYCYSLNFYDWSLPKYAENVNNADFGWSFTFYPSKILSIRLFFTRRWGHFLRNIVRV